MALALFFLPWVVALVLVRRHDYLDAAAVGCCGCAQCWLAPDLAGVGGLPGSTPIQRPGERPEHG